MTATGQCDPRSSAPRVGRGGNSTFRRFERKIRSLFAISMGSMPLPDALVVSSTHDGTSQASGKDALPSTRQIIYALPA